MVKYSSLDSVFAALADPIRRRIIQQLRGGSAPVGTLAKPFKVSAPAVSRHLRVLERAGLIRRKKVGRIHEIEFQPDSLRAASDWIELHRQHWEASLDSLARYLESNSDAPASDFPKPNSEPQQPAE